jgi:mannan endo-1,4-beta-mannosidase
MINRFLFLGLSLIPFASMTQDSIAADPFVSVQGRHFTLDSIPWYVCGTNLWYGANIGRPSNPQGRARLVRELDRLEKLGINNLRVLGASEECAVASTLRPAITRSPGEYDEDVLLGLDFLIQEAGKRHMKVVVFLNNYWDWSGGMPQYLSWATGKPAKGLADLPWKEWNRLQSTFYTNDAAQAMFRRYIAMILVRRNTLTDLRYCDDPTIMTWELANEPRPGERDEDNPVVFATFLRWVEATSAYIHSLDPNHLVTTGSEGTQGSLYSIDNFRREHAVRSIDYVVFHMWPFNWGWFDRDRFRETIPETLAKAGTYFREHVAAAESLNKPVVIEEFGLDRDGGLSPDFPVTSRDRLYREVFAMIEESAGSGGSAAGSNFWLWGGEGRPPRAGDPPPPDGVGAGDMLQEKPGLNTVFDSDQSTLEILAGHYSRLRSPVRR